MPITGFVDRPAGVPDLEDLGADRDGALLRLRSHAAPTLRMKTG
jgi:hypothetical protein